MEETINRGGLIGGIGLFLFGMNLFEHAIQESGKGWLKKTLKNYTSNLFKSIITGTLQTFVFQSSTIVTMITLGFVGAGLIGLYNALGVVLGANIGSSLTTWLVAMVGFNFKIEAYVLPLIGLSGLTMVMVDSHHKAHKIAKLVIGFSLLFLGLGYMKESVDSMTNNVNFASYADWSVRGFIAIGTIITTIIQTSTGVTIMTLVALSGGIITLDMGLGIIIGANLGSALSTGVIGFISATAAQHTKKQVAISQIIFNVVTAAIIIPLIQPIKHLIVDIMGVNNDETALAIFHTIFNTMLVVIWPIILKPYSRHLAQRFIKHQDHHKLNIEMVNTGITEEVIGAINKDVYYLFTLIKEYNSSILGEGGPKQDTVAMTELYNQLKATQTTLLSAINYQQAHCTDTKLIHQFEDINEIILDGCASSASLRESLDHCENIAQDQEHGGYHYYQTRKDLLTHIISGYGDPSSHQSFQTYYRNSTQEIIKHRQIFMKLVQQQTELEQELISELIKTDHYIVNSCQELLKALGKRHDISHKVLD